MADWVSLFDGQVDVAGVMSPEQLALVPAKRGVLALLADDGAPILLLTAADMRSRLRNRLTAPDEDKPGRSADLRTVTRKVLYTLAPSHFAADLRYAELARAIWPERYASMLAWKPAWFVHIDLDERFPHVVRTREIGSRPGRYIGPFGAARHAERFATLIVEAFDLCRDIRTLRQAPNAQPCAYAQMGRCPSPCDGSMSMSAYIRLAGEALAFARDRSEALPDALGREMRRAAEALEFERAAGLKKRIGRLGEFGAAAFAQAQPLERFNFVIIQPSGSVRRAEAFIACGPAIVAAATVDYPTKGEQLDALAAQASALARQPRRWDRFGRLMAGLVGRYLFSSARRRGVMVRWDATVTGERLGSIIDASAGVLSLRAPSRGRKKNGPAPGTGGPS